MWNRALRPASRRSASPGRVKTLGAPRGRGALYPGHLILALLGLCVSAHADIGDDDELWRTYDVESLSTAGHPTIRFPVTYSIPEDSRLLLLGERVLTATLAIDDQGRLTLNGTAILPADPLPDRTWTEDDYRKLYGEVPLVQRLVAEGHSWTDARNTYMEAFRALVDLAYKTSYETYGRAADWPAAVETTAAALAAADSLGLLSEPVRARGSSSTLVLNRKGLGPWELRGARVPQPPPDAALQSSSPGPNKPSMEDLLAEATKVYFWTSGLGGHPFLYCLPGGYTHLIGHPAVPVIAQVDRILAGDAIKDVGKLPVSSGEWTTKGLETLFPLRQGR
jgi:hypothetical protein